MMKKLADLLSIVAVVCLAWPGIVVYPQASVTGPNVTDWELLRILGLGSIGSIAYSPDGVRLAVASSIGVVIWDTEKEAVDRVLVGHTSSVLSVAWSPDGSQIASGSGDRTIKIWDGKTGDLLRTLTAPAASPYEAPVDGMENEDSILGILIDYTSVRSVAWSPDGAQVAGGSEGITVRIWDVATGRLVRTIVTEHVGWVSSVTWSPDGSMITSTGGWRHFGEVTDRWIKVWNAKTGNLIRTIFGYNPDSSVSWSPDSSKLAGGSLDETVKFRRPTVKIWEVKTGDLIRTLTGHTQVVKSVSWSPDGWKIASGSSDNTVKLWEAETGELINTLAEHTGGVLSVSWSPDSAKIASGSWDNTVQLWEAESGDLISTLTGHTDAVHSVSWSPDSAKIASGTLGRVNVWGADTGTLMNTFGHVGQVVVAWSPDGSQIAGGCQSGSRENIIKLWEAETGNLIRTLTGLPI